MPVVGSDLGLACLAAVLAAVIWLWARRRWRAAAARAEEVRRLTWLAAAEAARAEAEAEALAYAPPSLTSSKADDDLRAGDDNGGIGDWAMRTAKVTVTPVVKVAGPPQCAVCYKETRTRCSRCKAVRYCSGKCQIIHWRQGHKDDCRPPRIDEHDDGGESASSLKGLQTNRPDLAENSLGIETEPQSLPLGKSPGSPPDFHSSPDVSKEGHIEDLPGVERYSDSCADSSLSTSSPSLSRCSTFSGLLETSDSTSVDDNPHNLHFEKMRQLPRHDFLTEDSLTTRHTSKANPKTDLHSSVVSSINNLTRTSNIEPKVHSSKVEATDCSSSDNSRSSSDSSGSCIEANSPEDAGKFKHDHVQMATPSASGASLEPLSSETRSANQDHGCRIAQSEGTAQPKQRCLAAVGTDNSSSVSSVRSSDGRLLKAKSARLPTSFSSVDHESPNYENHSVSRNSSALKNENAPRVHTKPVETTSLGPGPNGISEFTTSMKRVVQQFASSHLSKNSSGPRNDLSRKYKIIFPYELFVKLYNDKVEMRPCGLTNCGNSCYANCVLQCLAFTRPLASYLLQGLHAETCASRDWCFTCEFGSLLVKSKKGESPLSPIGILSRIHNIGNNLGHGKEEDAHEFLRYAIDTMQSVCLKEAGTNAAGTAGETTLIQLSFGGYIRSKIKCTRCRGKSERQEKIMDLTVEIHGDIGTLEEALARFTATELLDGENKYYCSRCKSYERAKKKLTVWEAPNILTIVLKRFQSGKFGKLNKAVRFPEILDLAPYMSGTDDKNPVYSLYAVVVHQDIMNASFSGHYVCYVKSAQGTWYKTNDSMVKLVDIGRVLTKNAYMLFYARCLPRAPSLIRRAISNDHQNFKRMHAPSVTQHKSHDHHLYRDHNRPINVFDQRLPFPRTDSSSDNSSLLSCSDEGSCSTDSTRDSTTSTDEIFGESGGFQRNWSSAEDSDGFSSSPFASRQNLPGDGEVLNYGERLSWERREGLGLEGRDCPPFLYSDTTNHYRKLTGDSSIRGRETDRRDNVLIKRSTSTRERRVTFY